MSIYGGLRRENYILFVGCIVTRFGSMVNSMLTMILNQKLNLSATWVSAFLVGFSVLNMLAGIAGGKLADRFSKKNCIIICDCISVALYFICAVSPLNMFTLGCIALAASMQYMERPMYNALIADITPFKDREKAYALQYLGINIGLMFAPTLAGILFKNHLNLLFVICGAAIGSSTILIFFLVKNVAPEKVTNAKELRRDGESLLKIVWEDKTILCYLLVVAIYSAIYSQYSYLMPLDLGRMYGDDGAVLFGTISSTNCIIVVVFSSIMLKTMTRIKPYWKMFLAQVFILIGFSVYLIFITKILAYYVAITLFTFGEISSMLGTGAFFMAHTPESHRGRINAFREVLSQLADSLMILLSGYLYDNHGFMSSWTMVLIVAVLLICATAMLNLFVIKKRKY